MSQVQEEIAGLEDPGLGPFEDAELDAIASGSVEEPSESEVSADGVSDWPEVDRPDEKSSSDSIDPVPDPPVEEVETPEDFEDDVPRGSSEFKIRSGHARPDAAASSEEPPMPKFTPAQAVMSLARKLAGIARVTHIGVGRRDGSSTLIVLVLDHLDDSFIPRQYLGYAVETKQVRGLTDMQLVTENWAKTVIERRDQEMRKAPLE